MAKVTKNPANIKVKTSNTVTRSTGGFSGSREVQRKKFDKTKILKGKNPGSSLDDYTLDLMKLS